MAGGAALITDPPPTRTKTLSHKKLQKMSLDTWHVTSDTWWRVNIFSKFPLSSSYAYGLGWTRMTNFLLKSSQRFQDKSDYDRAIC